MYIECRCVGVTVRLYLHNLHYRHIRKYAYYISTTILLLFEGVSTWKCTRTYLRESKIQKNSWGAYPQTTLDAMAFHTLHHGPPLVSQTSPLSHFLDEGMNECSLYSHYHLKCDTVLPITVWYLIICGQLAMFGQSWTKCPPEKLRVCIFGVWSENA